MMKKKRLSELLCDRGQITDVDLTGPLQNQVGKFVNIGEVRHCLPGVGVGVEFIGLGAETAKIIGRELELNNGGKKRSNKGGKGEKVKKRKNFL